MNSRVSTVARMAEGRYPSPEECRRLREYAASAPLRIEVAERVEQTEEAMLAPVIEEMKKRHPEFATYRDQPWARLYRDLQLVLRSCVQALVYDDQRLLDDRVLYWVRSVAAASNVPAAFLNECYSLLRDQCRSKLSDSGYSSLKPLLDRVIEVLGQPEPQAQSA